MHFAFRNQPYKLFYWSFAVLILLFVRLPIWVIRNVASPTWRPRKNWSLGRSIIVQSLSAVVDIMFNTSLLKPEPLEKAALNADILGFVWVEATPDLIVGDIRHFATANHVQPARIAGYWYGPRDPSGAVGQKASTNETVVYHLHGGGFVMGTAHPSMKPMVHCFNGFMEHFPNNPRVFGLEYRIASAPPFVPENPFPAPLIDAIAGYRYLVEDVGFKAENIIVSGDSAGGALAYQLARYLAVNKLPNLRSPGALLLLSPTVDWAVTHNGSGSSMQNNSCSDFIPSVFSSGYSARAILGALSKDEAAENPWISPASLKLTNTTGLFAEFPTTCIVSGSAEMTLDAMRTLKQKMLLMTFCVRVGWSQREQMHCERSQVGLKRRYDSTRMKSPKHEHRVVLIESIDDSLGSWILITINSVMIVGLTEE